MIFRKRNAERTANPAPTPTPADTVSSEELLLVEPAFDRAHYLKTYVDVAAAGLDPVRHYLTSGWREGRNPSTGFNTTHYLSRNADVAASGMNPLVHYLRHVRHQRLWNSLA